VDDSKQVGKLRTVLDSSVTALQSYILDDVKWDANKVLQAGVLPNLILRTLGVPCLGWMALE